MMTRVRELAIQLVLFVYWLAFTCCKLFPLRDRTIMIETIGQQGPFVIDAWLEERPNWPIVVLKRGGPRAQRAAHSSIHASAQPPAHAGTTQPKVIPYPSRSPIDFLQSMYYIATSRYILIDNYHAFLAVVKFKPGVTCVQLWHASGGFKRTGLKDQRTDARSLRAQRRFRRVYDQYDILPVGSDALAQIHMDAFGLSESRMIPLGVPRTDLFFDEDKQARVRAQLYAENPSLAHKKVLLYAPTYRDNELEHFQMQLDLDKLRHALGDDYVLMLRLHPAIRQHEDYAQKYPGFVYDYSSYPGVNELLLVTDILITDYSSVICEYALLGRPMIFYLYDLDTYVRDRGLWEGYEQRIPGPVVKTTEELIDVVQSGSFQLEKVAPFADLWHRHSTGQSSRQLVRYLLDPDFRDQVTARGAANDAANVSAGE